MLVMLLKSILDFEHRFRTGNRGLLIVLARANVPSYL